MNKSWADWAARVAGYRQSSATWPDDDWKAVAKALGKSGSNSASQASMYQLVSAGTEKSQQTYWIPDRR
ncbi:MAG: hypothetical protein FWG30_01100 [Eubacteriaceae bacterium]|nr:hypothetical protein [Eubacteriaceae bacterium]